LLDGLLFHHEVQLPVGQSLVGEDEPTRVLSSTAVRIESSYVIDLCDLEMNHIKDFTFVHG
jgi:cleavage and polyadenylation specificity factor subunit 1